MAQLHTDLDKQYWLTHRITGDQQTIINFITKHIYYTKTRTNDAMLWVRKKDYF